MSRVRSRVARSTSSTVRGVAHDSTTTWMAVWPGSGLSPRPIECTAWSTSTSHGSPWPEGEDGSRGSTRSAVRPPVRRLSTVASSNASTQTNRSPSPDPSQGTHCSWLVASSGAHARSASGVSVLCTTRNRSAAGSTSYSTPSRRGASTRQAPRVVGVEQVHLGGRLRAEAEQEPALVAAGRDAHPEPLVVLLVDQHVVGRVAADPVPPQLVRAPGVVEPGVEHEPAVAAELDAVADAGDGGVEDLAGGDLADGEGEALVARGVDGERDEPVVGADGERPQREELAVPGLDVAVDDDLLARHGIRLGVGTHGGVGRAARARARRTAGPRRCGRSTTTGRSRRAPTGRSP